MKIAPATFPSDKNLQPIPTYVHPNLSGNVDSTSTPSPFVVPVEQVTPPPPTIPEKPASHTFITTASIIIVLFIFGFLFYELKKRKAS